MTNNQYENRLGTLQAHRARLAAELARAEETVIVTRTALAITDGQIKETALWMNGMPGVQATEAPATDA